MDISRFSEKLRKEIPLVEKRYGDKKKQKQSGSFYTPKKIVDYMIEFIFGHYDYYESLSFEELNKIKALEPCCGSGSFIIELYDTFLSIKTKKKGSDLSIEEKIDICKHNIRAFDIDENSVSITKKVLFDLICENIEVFDGLKEKCYKVFDGIVKCKDFLLEKIDDKFDIVIMNPPYVQLQKIPKSENRYQDMGFKTYIGTGDIYQLFMEKALNLTKEDGLVSCIVSNKWMRSGYGKTTRAWLHENSEIYEILDLGGGQFDHATVDTCIITFHKRKNKETQSLINCWSISNADLRKISIEEAKNNTDQLMMIPNHEDPCIMMNEIERSILEKIKKAGKPLKEWDVSINRGILTGLNEAFIIDGATKDQLIQKDIKSHEIIKPILRGRDIKRYHSKFADKWLINTHNGIRSKNIEPINIDDYPAIKAHLDQYFDQLEKRQDQGDTPYNLRNCAYHEDFAKPKIVYQEICQEASFAYDESNYYPEASSFMLTSKKNNLKYLLGIFNSQIYEYSFRKFFAGGGLGNKGFRYKKAFFENIPIPVPTPEQEKEIVDLVTTILDKKEKKQDTSQEESEIDFLVAEFYGLTEEEIEFLITLNAIGEKK